MSELEKTIDEVLIEAIIGPGAVYLSPASKVRVAKAKAALSTLLDQFAERVITVERGTSDIEDDLMDEQRARIADVKREFGL